MNGAAYNVQTGDGGAVGYNADTTVAPGQSLTYYWRAPSKEGLYYFHDQASLAGSEADGGSNAHGLFGALAVEPAGSRWYDPVSGAELSGRYPYRNVAGQSGELYINATIVPPAAAGRSFDGRTPRIQAKDAVAFREMVVISQDEMPGIHLQNCDLFVAAGKLASPADCADAGDGQVAAFGVGFDHSLGLGFNYGSEHLFMRSEPINRCPDCVGEETWLSSWPYGDPALVKLASGLGPWYPAWHPLFPGNGGQQNPGRQVDPEDCGIPTGCYTANVIHAYVHDATKVRFLHAGPKETHVFHMHAHQWLSDPQDVGDSGYTPGQPGLGGVNANKPQATTIDSQTYGPGEAFTNDVLFGAGSKPGTVGDTIFHCHLYPHFAEGFWALWRVHDALEDGTARTPDGILVHALLPLPDRSDAPAQATAASPGFPRFIPGEVGWRAPPAAPGRERGQRRRG